MLQRAAHIPAGSDTHGLSAHPSSLCCSLHCLHLECLGQSGCRELSPCSRSHSPQLGAEKVMPKGRPKQDPRRTSPALLGIRVLSWDPDTAPASVCPVSCWQQQELGVGISSVLGLGGNTPVPKCRPGCLEGSIASSVCLRKVVLW